MNQGLPPDEVQLLVGISNDGIPSMELPVDEEAQSGLPPPISMRTTSGISASHQPTTRLGPFCRAAEAGHLLGQVLTLVGQASYTCQMDLGKAQDLDSAMQSFGMTLVQQAINGWEECCAAIGLCLRYKFPRLSIFIANLVSAMVLLHESTFNLFKDAPG